jgi:DNA-binding IclR family transcriptional regulator
VQGQASSEVQLDQDVRQVTRLLRRLHAHGLIAKIPRSRRWRVSLGGRRLMASAIKLREVAFPKLFAQAA